MTQSFEDWDMRVTVYTPFRVTSVQANLEGQTDFPRLRENRTRRPLPTSFLFRNKPNSRAPDVGRELYGDSEFWLSLTLDQSISTKFKRSSSWSIIWISYTQIKSFSWSNKPIGFAHVPTIHLRASSSSTVMIWEQTYFWIWPLLP